MNAQWKAGVIIENDSGTKVVLIKEKIKKKKYPLWNIIKGSYEEEDGSILRTAKRECLEEAGVRVELVNFLGIYTPQDKEKNSSIQANFIAKIKNGIPYLPNKETQKKREEDFRDIQWFSKSQLEEMKPEDFISRRAFQALHDWKKGKRFELSEYKKAI